MSIKENAQEILKYIGSANNVKGLTHCATRLRFSIKDFSKIDESSLKKIRVVLGTVKNGDQYHVIIGQDVGTYYKEIEPLLNQKSHSTGSLSTEKISLFNRFSAMISNIFSPVLPVLVAYGLISAFLALGTAFKFIPTDSNTYIALSFIGNSGSYFLPIYLGFSAAKRFGCNQYLGAMLGAILVHPNFVAIISEGKPFDIFGLPVTLVDYSGSVIPIILAVWIMSFVEKFVDKHSPTAVKFFLKPLITILVMSIVLLVVIGPLGALIGNYVADVFSFLGNNASWLATTLMAIFTPIFVMTGIAYSFMPVAMATFAKFGFDNFGTTGMLCANVAAGGAALCVAARTKNLNLKALASTAGLTAVLGITEPALYGVNLKLKKPLYGAMIGAGVGGLYAGIMAVNCYAFASPGLASIAVFIAPDNNSNLINALIAAGISFTVAFIATWILGFEDIVDEEEVETVESEQGVKAIINGKISSPVAGKLIPLSEVKDEVFSKLLVGNGIAILPEDNNIYAPIDGIITSVFPSKHAIGILGDNGVEILIHVGLDTVNLNGQYFESFVNNGDRIKKGDKLLTVDLVSLKTKGYDTVVMVIVTNTNDYATFKPLENGQVKAQDLVLEYNS